MFKTQILNVFQEYFTLRGAMGRGWIPNPCTLRWLLVPARTNRAPRKSSAPRVRRAVDFNRPVTRAIRTFRLRRVNVQRDYNNNTVNNDL